jgi:hypothetical protein
MAWSLARLADYWDLQRRAINLNVNQPNDI